MSSFCTCPFETLALFFPRCHSFSHSQEDTISANTFFFLAETAHSYRSSQVIIFTEVGAKLKHTSNKQKKSAGSCKKKKTRENTFSFPFPSVPVFSSACCVYTDRDLLIVHVYRYLLCMYTHMHTCTFTLYMYVCIGVCKEKTLTASHFSFKVHAAQQQPPPALAPPPLDGMLGLVGECWGPILMPLASLFMSKTPS